MSDIAIKIEGLSKQYRLGVVGTGTLSHDLQRWWTMSILGREDPYLKIGETNTQASKGSSEYVWALRDINLEVRQGEILGIIGKNGAGKSTLLKILSRVTKPTTGSITYKGRIASLLEVGTGFHPEMTGRENIYMNGTIMGMTRSEINQRLEEIIDFAGVERYIDTPVKRYSSGMKVRLGFAVAAHLEPEILVVDEVLAVGDAEFQKKAIGKMQDVSKGEGRTVLFVSHNMAAITDLCPKSVLLVDGKVAVKDNSTKVINYYLKENDKIKVFNEWLDLSDAPGDNIIRIKRVYVIDEKQKTRDYLFTSESIGISIDYEIMEDTHYFTFGINLFREDGLQILSSHDSNKYVPDGIVKKGRYTKKAWIPSNLLQEGDYIISLAAMRYSPFRVLFHEKDMLLIKVIDTVNNISRPKYCNRYLPGVIRPLLNWENS